MGYFNALLIQSGFTIIAALGLAVLTGYTGLFSIGHAGFMAIGGYMSAVLVKEFGVPLVLALACGGIVAGLSSFIIGFPAFRSRLRGDYFAIATLGFSEAVRLVLNNVSTIGKIKLGGAFGYMSIGILTTVPLTVITVLLMLFLAHMFVSSQYGKNCQAISQDEVAAEMMGVNLLGTKLLALFISAFFCGIAGGLMGFYYGYLSPSFFNIARSTELLAAVVFGGLQSLIGPFITAAFLVVIPQLLLVFSQYRLVFYGLLFVIVMLFRPQGLMGYIQIDTLLGKLFRKKAPACETGDGPGGPAGPDGPSNQGGKQP